MSYLNVYILPISGGKFVSQVALLSEIYEAHRLLGCPEQIKPDIMLSSSGGNISSYIGLAAQWKLEGMIRVLRKLDTKMFVRSWWPDSLSFLPSKILSIIAGSLYRSGYGCESLFTSLFTTQTVQDVEIWTGTYDIEHKMTQLFCNKSIDNSIITGLNFENERYLYASKPLQYLNGNLKSIANATSASAAIPFLTQSCTVENTRYVDGGAKYPSPICVLSEQVQHVVTTNDYRLRLIYISSFELDMSLLKYKSKSLMNIIDNLIHSMDIQDRIHALNLLIKICGGNKDVLIHEEYDNVNTMTLAIIFKRLEKAKHYMLYIAPYGRESINITAYNVDDCLRMLDRVRQKYLVKVWYC